MAEPERRRVIDIAPAAIAKVLAAIVLVWLWLHLWQLLLLVVIAIFLAIALDPLVDWLQRYHVPRALAASGAVFLLAGAVVAFFWITGASLVDQARELGGRISAGQQRIIQETPPLIKDTFKGARNPLDASAVGGYVLGMGRLAVGGAIAAALGLILTVYLLLDGRRTYAWVSAYVPPEHRNRFDVTAREARNAIYGYVVGNVATSIFATIAVFAALSLLHVPAALLLSLLAGVFDFVPVLGFICSAVPAVLLALSRSALTAMIVAAVYVGYHMAENYYIGPKVYGGRLRLSNLAVILAFAVGAEVGGVVGALLALPIAALYPVVERVWLKEYLNRDAVAIHDRLEHESGH